MWWLSQQDDIVCKGENKNVCPNARPQLSQRVTAASNHAFNTHRVPTRFSLARLTSHIQPSPNIGPPTLGNHVHIEVDDRVGEKPSSFQGLYVRPLGICQCQRYACVCTAVARLA